MTDSLHRSISSGNGSSQNITQEIAETDVQVTGALTSSPARPPDLAAEIQALQILAQQLMDDPQAMLKTLVEIVLERCQAGTAGVSLVETTPNGESVFRWVAIAGALADLEQTAIPGGFSSWSTTLRSNQPQLYAYPERYFTHLHHPQFPIVEGLLIPLCVNRQPLGTLWLLSHDEARRFDSEDQRLMTSLAGFTACALQSIQQLRQTAEDALRREQEAHTEQARAAVALRQSEEFNQQILDSSDDCIKVLDLEGRILFMSSRGQALLRIQDITPFLNASWVEFWQGADQEAAVKAIARAKAGEVCTFEGYRPTQTGEPKWWDNKVSPIPGSDGQVERLLCISRDITQRRRIEDDRKQAEDRLRESEKRLSAMFSQAKVGLSEVSLDGQFQRVNDELCRIMGRSRQEMLAASVPDITYPEDMPKSLEALKQLLKIGEPVSLDKRYQRPDGTIVWANSSLTRLDDEQVRPRAILAVTVDLSDRIQAEEKLRESEARYRAIVNQVVTGVAYCVPNGKLTLVNQKYCEITGYSAVELSQLRMDEITHPDDLPRNAELYNRMLTEGTPFEIEKRYIRKDGAIVWVNNYVSPICDREGKPQSIVAIVLDITRRKQAEAEREQLLANERHYAKQLQGLTTTALAVNSALSVEEVLKVITNQATSIIGAHQSVTSVTIDQNWAQAINTVHLSDKYAQWRDYAELPDGSGIYACVCHLNRPMRMTQAELEAHPHWKGFGKEADKHPPMQGWLAAPLVGRDGNNIGLIQLSDKYEGEFTPSDESILVQLAQMASVAVENARLYEAEQQARSVAEASREEAQAANRVKDEFLAVLSHELRSPLNPILGWSTLLQTNKLDAAKTAQALAIIQRNAKLQSELIEDLLDVSRILRGKLSLNVAPVHLASIMRAAMETVRLAAEAKSIKVEASLELDIGLVSGDSTRLQQVIWNLLSNAMKFTPQGGQVNIRLEHLDSYAQIAVSDTGQGIAPDFLPYVFDYFRQADAATTRKFGGLGLGLAIVRHLVELHGGTVKVESPGEGQGATFIVRLPLMPTPLKANRDERSSQQSFDLNDIKILVVDDETDTREFVAFLLEQSGAQVTAVSSAHEALAILTQSKPDLLLSDIGMPDVDGYMLLQQVRALSPHGGQIPAIALTAYAGDINQQQVIAAGFQKHISKPIEPQVLVQEIASLVRST